MNSCLYLEIFIPSTYLKYRVHLNMFLMIKDYFEMILKITINKQTKSIIIECFLIIIYLMEEIFLFSA